MSINYDSHKKTFVLNTRNTTYAFEIAFDKFLAHVYYGKKIDISSISYERKYRSFSPYHEQTGTQFSPDTNALEYSTFGNGDFRATALRIKNADGNSVTGLVYKSYRIFDGRLELSRLPYADADDTTKTLEISMTDIVTGVDVNLYYTVFEKEDVISRYVTIKNSSERNVIIEKCMSLMLDLPECDYDMISLYGGQMHERSYERHPLFHGLQSVASRRGASSHQFNPFIAICDKNADHESGDVYGFNFVYSGNFIDEVDVDQCNSTRILIGLGSENFNYLLKPGEEFVSPEAVMTYTADGIGQMSRNFHDFTRNHILPPEPFENRPVVLNTWEACYFDIDEAEMLRFATAAKDAGIDMLVMDDGWFGARNDNKSSLGDWFVNEPKFKNGLKSFVDKVKSYGIKFGIWIEPEMISPVSKLYDIHPDWCVQVTGRESLLSRNQLVLDMANPDVIEYLKKSFSETFDGVSIDYFKWDMNRHMSEVGSNYLPSERQGEAAYRYMLGVYDLFRWFKEKYPNAMIENCSGGGGRYDLGMMKYSTMIWTSDNTFPKPRIKIQYSSMLAYPAATMSCHVSKPIDLKDLDLRYRVALGGALGYELHLPNASDDVIAEVKKQVKNYRKYEKVILNGDYYPLVNPFESVGSAYYYIDKERNRILLSFLQNSGDSSHTVRLRVKQAIPEATYYDEINDIELKGTQLIDGITIRTANTDTFAMMWYFVKR